MHADQWLADVFAPTLDRESLAYTTDAAIMAGQLRALHDCGVLNDDAHAEARRSLDKAVEAARERARLQVRPAAANELATTMPELLHRVLAVGQPLADIDGMLFVLTSVELWDNRIEVVLAGVPTAQSRQHIHRHEAELNEWARHQRSGLSGEGTITAPQPRGNRISDVEFRVPDDLGTAYRTVRGSAGAGRAEWRLHRSYALGAPSPAAELVVEVADADGHAVSRLQLPL